MEEATGALLLLPTISPRGRPRTPKHSSHGPLPGRSPPPAQGRSPGAEDTQGVRCPRTKCSAGQAPAPLGAGVRNKVSLSPSATLRTATPSAQPPVSQNSGGFLDTVRGGRWAWERSRVKHPAPTPPGRAQRAWAASFQQTRDTSHSTTGAGPGAQQPRVQNRTGGSLRGGGQASWGTCLPAPGGRSNRTLAGRSEASGASTGPWDT